MPSILIPTPLRKFTGGNASFESEGASVNDILKALGTTYPGIKPHVFDEEGTLRSFIRVYVGDEDINALDGVDTAVKADEEISIIPAIAGGSGAVASPEPPVTTFSKEEIGRYSRHLIIPDFGIEGQRKLKNAKVLVVGSGGLGSPLLLYLAAAGVGTLGIVDYDSVDDSNLQRQVLFGVDSTGKQKVDEAAKRIKSLNPHIKVNTYNTMLSSENALDIIKDYDVVADGTDNFPTRYLVNDACVLLDKTNVYASIYRFDGQVSVFNELLEDGTRGPNYRDLFPTPPPPGLVPSCAEGGVIGVLPGIVGSLQALEVIKVITGVGDTLSGRLFTIDALTFSTRTLKVRKNPNNPLTGDNPTQTELIDYVEFCGLPQEEGEHDLGDEVAGISVQELAQWREEGRDFQLIDVREPHEVDIVEIQGELIPLDTVTDNVDRIASDKPVVVHCRSGVRSAKAIRRLNEQFGFTNLLNLQGGIIAWAEEVDTSLPVY
jgi:molybdopterin/thiamine biosynthesis adenylyltransferase/rhodanese-related sulfurtransferase/molybdopterin converting factor small subunit